MNDTIEFLSNNNNNYYYLKTNKILTFLHPIMAFVINNELEVKDFINSSNNTINISNIGVVKKGIIKYYLNKLSILNEYTISNNNVDFLDNRLNEKELEKNIANTQLILFEVTENCNLQCTYCGYGNLYENTNNRHNRTLSLTTAKKTLKEISKGWLSELSNSKNSEHGISFYGGEPLLEFYFIKGIVEYTKDLNLNIAFQMTTNGVLLDKYMDYLVEKKFYITISLDGNKEHNFYRKFKNNKSSFEHVFSNCKILKEKYPTYFNKNINFNAVYSDKSKKDEIKSFFMNEFNKDIQINNISKLGVNKNKIKEFNKLYKPLQGEIINDDKSIYQDYLALNKSIDSFIENSCGGKINTFSSFIYTHNKDKDLPTGTCKPLQAKLMVRADGSIHACESISPKFPFGRVTDKEFTINSLSSESFSKSI